MNVHRAPATLHETSSPYCCHNSPNASEGVILHLITDFTARAGAETMLARLLSAWRSPRTVVVSMRAVSDRNRDLVRNPAVAFEALGTDGLAQIGPAVRKLCAIIGRERPDAIVCWMYHAMVLGTIAQALSGKDAPPVFWNVRQSLDDWQSLSRSTRLALACARHLSDRPSGIIYNSMRARKLHAAYGFANENTAVIPNGFELPQLLDAPSSSSATFGIAGRFHPQKDYATFFKAAALVCRYRPNVRLVAVGKGVCPGNGALMKLLDDAQLPPERIDLRGEVDDMAAFYREIDCLVLSSRTEGFPNVVAEAMSFGKPVVTTDVGDAAAIVADTGFVCRPGDFEAIADGMYTVLDLSPAAYRSLCDAARRRIAESFTLDAVVGRYRSFIAAAHLVA
jgi:glycosyltransferase involved in cell wall biosynthesis